MQRIDQYLLRVGVAKIRYVDYSNVYYIQKPDSIGSGGATKCQRKKSARVDITLELRPAKTSP